MSAYLASDVVLCRPKDPLFYNGLFNYIVQFRPIEYTYIHKILGDIGVFFPPEDPQYAGADSRVLARRVAEVVAERGCRVINVDLTLLAERPKIRSRVPEMRAAIAEAIRVEPDRIGVKATTLEGLGSLGRAEGIACQAVALLSRSVAS